MKVQQPTRTMTPDDPIVTVDASPPEEGTYLVSYDFDALDSEGFEVKPGSQHHHLHATELPAMQDGGDSRAV